MNRVLIGVTLLCPFALAAGTRSVPNTCTGAVNQELVRFVTASTGSSEAQRDNIMACGTATRPSFSQHSSKRTNHGGHQVLSLSAPTPDGQKILVEIVTNDELDGYVSAATGDAVFAYGQAYIPSPNEHRPGGVHFAAGVHDTHCSTHRSADDGWVVVAGKRYPQGSCALH
jgi:hypothetical protein